MPNDSELLRFTEDWWSSFMVYEEEDGRAYARHLFEHVHKQHFVDFLRDAFAELTIADD
jgi:truncated hemoglobin YjbI